MLVALGAATAGATEQDAAITTTLCELIKRPELFNSRTVQLNAAISPGIEDSPTVLFDRGCSAVVAVGWPKKEPSRNVKEYRKLRRYVKKGQAAAATVTGRFAQTVVHWGNGATLDFRLDLRTVSDVVTAR